MGHDKRASVHQLIRKLAAQKITGDHKAETMERVLGMSLKEQQIILFGAEKAYRDFVLKAGAVHHMIQHDMVVVSHAGDDAKPRILIGMPHRDQKDRVGEGIYDRVIGPMQAPCSKEIVIDEFTGARLDNARNAIANRAVDEKFDWLLFLDDDVFPTSPTWLIDLLDSDREVVCGVYWKKAENAEAVPVVYDEDGKAFPVQPGHRGILPAFVVAGGLLLIKVSIFPILDAFNEQHGRSKAYFKIATSGERVDMSEDVYFTQLCKMAGIETWCNTSIKAKHFDKEKNVYYYGG